MSRRARVCEVCRGPVALINLDKHRGVVGLRMGFVHITRFGRIKRRGHRPVVKEDE